MKQPPPINDRINKLCREIIAQVDQGKMTLEFLERSLTEFAEHIRREAERQ